MAERMNGVYKLIDILEPLVHRGVAQIRHLIDCSEFSEHFRANYRRWDFASAGLQLVNNVIHHLFQGKETGGTFFESFRDTTSQFASVERFMRSIAFHHAQIRALNFFIRSKTIFAFQAFTSTTNAGSIPRLTGIDDLVVTRPALGATHSVEQLITTP